MGVVALSPRRSSLLAAGLALLGCGTGGLFGPVLATGAPPRHVPCSYVAASPQFATDHLLFCAAANKDGSGVDLYRSSDAGHTWGAPSAVERFPGYHSDGPLGIYPSPAFGLDHTVYVGTMYGANVSLDGGVTFSTPGPSPVAGTPTSPTLTPLFTVPFVDGVPGGAGNRPELIVAGAPPGGCCDTIVDAVLPSRPVPPNPPAVSEKYVVPPDYPSTHQAVLLSQGLQLAPAPVEGSAEDRAVEGHARVFACVGDFVCDEPIFDFTPQAPYTSSAIWWSGATYPAGPDNYALVTSGNRGDLKHLKMRVFRSTDFGRTWSEWSSVTKLLPAGLWSGQELYINASPDDPHRLFLHLIGGARPTDPDEQLFRSDDNGALWHRIGFAWGPAQKARSKSTLPWNDTTLAYEQTVVEPGGRLYLVGEHDTGKRTDYTGLYCSRDYGVHWSTTC